MGKLIKLLTPSNMRSIDLVRISLDSLLRNKTRAALTILGIVIGIIAVILMLSIGQGAERYILRQVADLGSDLIFVEASSGDPKQGPPNPFVEQSLRLSDVNDLKKSGLFSVVSPFLVSSSPATYNSESVFVQLYGVGEDYLSIFPADIADGRFLDENDVLSFAKVAVLGKEVAEDLFGDQNPVGQKIKIKKLNFEVIGVLEEQGSRFFQNLDKNIAIPISTAQRDVLGVDHVTFISARILPGSDIEYIKEEVRYVLRESHDIQNPEGLVSKDNFLVSSQSDAVEIIGAVGGVLTLLLSSIAAISLVVGGIGIMNIMLVSVTERTREIGLRKAIGARYKEILWQFLLEAVMLTTLGGIVGVIGGVGLSYVVAKVAAIYVVNWELVIPPEAIVASLVVSTFVGLIFGLYPARRAAKLDPIQALRYE